MVAQMRFHSSPIFSENQSGPRAASNKTGLYYRLCRVKTRDQIDDAIAQLRESRGERLFLIETDHTAGNALQSLGTGAYDTEACTTTPGVKPKDDPLFGA